MAALLALVACGRGSGGAVVVDAPNPAAAAAQLVAARDVGGPVVARGCARPDQVPGAHPRGTTVVCTFVRPYGSGEVRVALAPDPGGWRLLAVEDG